MAKLFDVTNYKLPIIDRKLWKRSYAEKALRSVITVEADIADENASRDRWVGPWILQILLNCLFDIFFSETERSPGAASYPTTVFLKRPLPHLSVLLPLRAVLRVFVSTVEQIMSNCVSVFVCGCVLSMWSGGVVGLICDWWRQPTDLPESENSSVERLVG